LSQLSKRALAIIKEQAAIDSVCFPETMCKMFIVNAPTFFAATWRLIKGWLDPRTASKIEVISSRKTMEKKIKEVVDDDQIPSDYGGTGPDTNTTINEMFNTGNHGADRVVTKMLYLRYVPIRLLARVCTLFSYRLDASF
jgi:CRAL/TRIO domain